MTKPTQSSTKKTQSERTSERRWMLPSVVALVLFVGAYLTFRNLQDTSGDEVESDTVKIVESDGDPETSATSSTQPAALLDPAELAALPLPDRITQAAVDAAEHPFDPLLAVAQTCLDTIDRDIKDYTATLTSQVRIDGKLLSEKQVFCKIRHERTTGEDQHPFSVYTKFLKPKANAGQEAIWVDGWNDGNLVAHLTGFSNVKRFYLSPDSSYAMEGNRYPIREIGFRNLIVKMAEVGKHDRNFGECVVTVKKNIEVGGRKCTLLQAMHPEPREHFEFHLAKIYIDDEYEIPAGYEGYLWPETPGEEPVLIEKYYYTDVKLNVGLQDIDFDPANKAYDYPSW